MQNNMTVDELTEFEVAYAPPYSHPKDLINMIGYKVAIDKTSIRLSTPS
jgi:CoA-disulfide reductase